MFGSVNRECEAIERRLAAGFGGEESDAERADVLSHLNRCPACSEHTPKVRNLRWTLRSLPKRSVPTQLQTRLSVLASKEALRASRRSSAKAWARHCWLEARLVLQNMMRPLALPTAGGFVSAIFLFALLGSNLSKVSSAPITPDVPTVLYTEASVKNLITLGFDIHHDCLIEVTVDNRGRMNNYRVLNGQRHPPALRRHIENSLLLTQFKPATSFGQPTAGGRLLLWFRANSTGIDVKG
jgi:hypothetical protein